MGVDSQTLGNKESPHSLEFEGITYNFSLIDQAAKAEWEKRLYRRAVEGASALASLHPDAWLEDRLVDLNDAFVAGDFSLFSESSKKLLGKAGGAGILLSILTGKNIEDLTQLLLAKSVEIKALLRIVFKESFPNISLKDEEGEEEKNATSSLPAQRG